MMGKHINNDDQLVLGICLKKFLKVPEIMNQDAVQTLVQGSGGEVSTPIMVVSIRVSEEIPWENRKFFRPFFQGFEIITQCAESSLKLNHHWIFRISLTEKQETSIHGHSTQSWNSYERRVYGNCYPERPIRLACRIWSHLPTGLRAHWTCTVLLSSCIGPAKLRPWYQENKGTYFLHEKWYNIEKRINPVKFCVEPEVLHKRE